MPELPEVETVINIKIVSMNDKEELISKAEEIISFITNDCRTFIYYRTAQRDIFEHAGMTRTGGGNLLMALGLFVALELMSKIYSWVKINNVSQDTSVDFGHLVTDCPIPLGIDSETAVMVWKSWRNPLAHTGIPVVPNQAQTFSAQEQLTYSALITNPHIFSSTTTFHQQDNRWLCNVDCLVYDIDQIWQWLKSQINTAPNRNTQKALKWFEEKTKW